MVRERVKVLGLELKDIGLEQLEEIALKIQDRVEELLKEMLPLKRSYDADIVVSLENRGDRVDVYIDVGVIGRLDDVVDYDSVVQVIIREAKGLVEGELQRYVKKNA